MSAYPNKGKQKKILAIDVPPEQHSSPTNEVRATINNKEFLASIVGGKYEELGEGYLRLSWGIGLLTPEFSLPSIIWIELDSVNHNDDQEYNPAAPESPVTCWFSDAYNNEGETLIYPAISGTVKLRHNMDTKIMEGEFSFDVTIPDENNAFAHYTIKNGHIYIGPTSP